MYIRFSPREAGKIGRTISSRFTILGEHTRTIKYINNVMELPMNKADDVRVLFEYLSFVIVDLVGILNLFIFYVN